MIGVHIILGPQGAGKTTYAKMLAEKVNGVHLSIDEWMWDLYGPDLPKPMNFTWIMKRVERCEKQIWLTAKKISKCGCPVILDLGFTKLEKRQLFTSMAKDNNISAQLHYIDAPHSLRRRRVLERNITKGETFSFEVTPGMFDFMEKEFERPTQQELANAILVDTNDDD